MTATVSTTCRRRGCDKPTLPGRKWHPWCLVRYRRSVDYRTPTLRRDGHRCVRCNRLQNAYAELWARRTGRPRKLEADHIVPIGGEGTHDQHNLQTLCQRHHDVKTKRDLAKLFGHPDPTAARR
ncbi:MAG TPA: HNH endonuclease, partial [Jiangellaceae bacterium]|nr:HNH endonuclease [Jiangellaceae bacterium]